MKFRIYKKLITQKKQKLNKLKKKIKYNSVLIKKQTKNNIRNTTKNQ